MVYDIILGVIGALSIVTVVWIRREWYWVDQNGTVRDVLPPWKVWVLSGAVALIILIGILL